MLLNLNLKENYYCNVSLRKVVQTQIPKISRFQHTARSFMYIPEISNLPVCFRNPPKPAKVAMFTAIELPKEILSSETAFMNLAKAMQYSRSNQGSGGIRIKDNIEIFRKNLRKGCSFNRVSFSSMR